ncbi:hypothetical protein MJH12_04275, partial [bacterium]|nr:hypothetical protein [bacterium]
MKNLFKILFLLVLIQSNTSSDFHTFQYGFTFTDSLGQPLRLNRFLAQVKFSLFSDETNADPITDIIRYQESFQNIQVKEGFMELVIGTAGQDGVGNPVTSFPDLSTASWVEVEIIIDLGDTPIVMTPRVRLPVVPMPFFVEQANKVGTLDEDGIKTFATDRMFELETRLTNQLVFLKQNQNNTITSTFTFDNGGTNIAGNVHFNSASPGSFSNTTRLSIVLDPASSPVTTFSVKNNGDLFANTLSGDGVAITNVVHTSGNQSISGEKTFSNKMTVNTTLEATIFKGNGQQLSNVLITDCGNITCPGQLIKGELDFTSDIITTGVSIGDSLKVTGDISLSGAASTLIFKPATTPSGSASKIEVRSVNNNILFSVGAWGSLTAVNIDAQNITASSFIGDGNSITNLNVITSSLQTDSVTNGAILQDAINSIKILNQTILSEDIGASQVTTSNIAMYAVTSGKISGNIDLSESLIIQKEISKDPNNVFFGTLIASHVNLASDSQTGISTSNESYVSIGGGRYNTAVASYSHIGGGSKNLTEGSFSNIAGGFQNQALDSYSSVSGGMSNIASGMYSSILGGLDNQTKNQYASIVGGHNNLINNPYSSTSGGQYLTASGDHSFLGAGINNITTATAGAALGGLRNYVGGTASIIIGGSDNKNHMDYSSVIAGQWNTNDGINSTIISGKWNRISGSNSAVIAGTNNIVQANYSQISAGLLNTVTGTYSVISGGVSNRVGGMKSHVLGGNNNYIQGDNSTIISGIFNSTYANHSIILGGSNNKVHGTSSTILFGSNIKLNANNSIAISSKSTSLTINQSDSFIIDSLKVGINTTTPMAVLTLMSTTSTNPFAVQSLSFNSEPFFILTTSGRVGVHTTQPSFDMEILGTLKVQTIILADGS